MVRSNQKFSYVAAQDRLRAASLKDCSGKCSRETSCNTFSYSQHNGDCNLASLEANNLLSQDISYDSHSDIYRPLFGGNCGPGYYPNPGGNSQHHQGENNILTPHTSHLTSCTSGCARILRGQSRLSRLSARESVTARNLRDCEELCQTSQRFNCRSFSFSSTAGYTSNIYPNCQLSELDEINLTDRDLEPDYSGDVYILSSSCGGSSSGSSSGSSYISKYQGNPRCDP